MDHPLRTIVVFLGFAALAAAPATAQPPCETRWKEGLPAFGPAGNQAGLGRSIWWDPDGSGQRDPVLVCGGTFTIPSVGARNLAMWDPARQAWSAFPEQPDYHVAALVVLPTGELAIGGQFTSIGTTPASRLAIWDGNAWAVPGGGVNGSVQALLPLPNGDLVAGGSFTTAGGVPAAGLARWDGGQWRAFGAFSGTVQCLLRKTDGRIVVGGSFLPIGYLGNANIAEWTGTAWNHFWPGLGGSYSDVDDVVQLPNGNLVATGFFNMTGTAIMHRVACWDGTNWTPLGSGIDGAPQDLLVLPGGDLLAASMTSINLVPVLGVARWDGSQWLSHAPDIGGVASMTFGPDGDLWVTGALATNTGEPVRGVARWDGAAWHGTPQGFDNTVHGLVGLPNGELVAYGGFSRAEGTAVNLLARWNGQSWWPMSAAGAATPWSGIATCAVVDHQQTLWMAGSPSGTGSGYGGNVGRWTGSGWQTIGPACGAVTSLVVSPTGQPIVGTTQSFYNNQPVLAWNGAAWQPFGAGLDGAVRALVRRANGDLVAGGEFLNSGPTPVSRIARWDGAAWQPFGPGVDGPVRALVEWNGELIAAGDFVTDGLRPLNLIARWDGAWWQPLGAGLSGDSGCSVRALRVLHDGTLLAGGSFRWANGLPARGIARWNGAAWSAVDGGVDGTVMAIAQRPDGEVCVGGDFAAAGGKTAAHFARLRTTCPATSTPYGSGCAGSGGVLALESTHLPWLGSVHRAICYGVPATAFGVDLVGLQPAATPLTALHPAGGAGCLLLASQDSVTLRLPVNGAIATALPVPVVVGLIGLPLHHQVIVGEPGGPFTIAHVGGSNGLVLVPGVF